MAKIEWGGTPGPWRGVEQGEADSFALLANEDRWVLAFRQYRSDMLYPPAADSRERRVEMIDGLLATIDGVPR